MGGEKFRTHPDWPWGPPSPLYNGYRAFPSSAEVKERVELYLYSHSGSSWRVLGCTLRSVLMVLSKDGTVMGEVKFGIIMDGDCTDTCCKFYRFCVSYYSDGAHFETLTFRHRASCTLGQAFHYSP